MTFDSSRVLAGLPTGHAVDPWPSTVYAVASLDLRHSRLWMLPPLPFLDLLWVKVGSVVVDCWPARSK